MAGGRGAAVDGGQLQQGRGLQAEPRAPGPRAPPRGAHGRRPPRAPCGPHCPERAAAGTRRERGGTARARRAPGGVAERGGAPRRARGGAGRGGARLGHPGHGRGDLLCGGGARAATGRDRRRAQVAAQPLGRAHRAARRRPARCGGPRARGVRARLQRLAPGAARRHHRRAPPAVGRGDAGARGRGTCAVHRLAQPAAWYAPPPAPLGPRGSDPAARAPAARAAREAPARPGPRRARARRHARRHRAPTPGHRRRRSRAARV
mmetsp:Transcript_682/g.2085  ORF Transcript_682/g.2085 Transcript_682/m.2085 type:complete len:263 (+) Transcript_682:772-1560(+)